MPLDELGALHEHAARAAGRVVDLAVVRLDDLHDEADDRVRGEELSAEPALGHGEVREEVLVDEPEGVTGERARQRGEQAEQFGEGGLLQALVALREHISQLGVGSLHGPHGSVDRRPQVVPLGQAHEGRQAGLLGHVEHAPGLVVVGRDRLTCRGLRFQVGAHLFEAVLGVGEEDQAEHRSPVLVGRQRGVGPQFIGRLPQGGADLGYVTALHSSPPVATG